MVKKDVIIVGSKLVGINIVSQSHPKRSKNKQKSSFYWLLAYTYDFFSENLLT